MASRSGEAECGDVSTGILTTKCTNSCDAWYTLDGIRLDSVPTASGIYINNGKKIVIK